MKYEVHVHWFEPARPGEFNRRGRWLSISRRPLGLAWAQKLADEQPCHAVVSEWHSATNVHDNGKAPSDGPPPVAQPHPRIIRVLGVDDCPGATCPHCGAEGRYIHRVQLVDGRTIAAMSGCIKLFPVSPVADVHLKLTKKAIEYANKGWGLNRWDTKSLEAIEAFYAGSISEQEAMARVTAERRAAAGVRRARRS